MKKFVKILALVLCLVLCLSLFACVGKTTTNQDGNKIPENPGGTGDNNKPINLLDYFYETFEDENCKSNIPPLIDDKLFNNETMYVDVKTKVAVFIQTITLDIGYNGKLTHTRAYANTSGINLITKYLDLDCSMNKPVTYTWTLNKAFEANTIIGVDVDVDDNFDKDTNAVYMDNLRIKLKL